MLFSTNNKNYMVENSPDINFSLTGTNKYIEYFDTWMRDNSNDNFIFGNLIHTSIINSTYGKFSNKHISLTQALLDERKAEIDRENRKYIHHNG